MPLVDLSMLAWCTRLSWKVENVASVYGANCASDAGCDGIRFPLEKSGNGSTTDVLLVSYTGIPTSLLSPINMNIYWYSVGTTQWTILASTVEETRGAALTTETRPALMVLPRNFEVANTTLAEYMTEFGSCEMFIDKYIHQVEKNHLYIEHTLQPAYTAGLYVIFQNAMVRSQLPSNTSVYNDKTSLSFSGNSQDMYVRASVPWTNLILTVMGCIVVVVVGVFVAILAKQEEDFS
ncbi:hypothetical protein PPTG_04932 [Phytophthora nicotianae INRA-310]|uniref:Uncharacterized protein n=2 Tax=Phytophthora nicotianae TaxID=4792 RepID=W2R2U8_PHYN3|nr:hypothetical protein PPTG_04932 [Phytophthora nicotianae INRA-310]ETN19703.1 hypothetical protein PPTG_04932 [Phytophthora nicotianae INRA-310]